MFAFAYEFGSPSGALTFHWAANGCACTFANRVHDLPTDPALAGVVALQVRYASGDIADQASFVAGNRRYYVALHDRAERDGADELADLVRAVLAP